MDEHVPLILKHCFKDMKKQDEGNVSTICTTCGKTLKGSLVATTNFLNHLKTKGHTNILKEYEKLKVSHGNIKRKTDDQGSVTHHTKMKQTFIDSSGIVVNLDNLIVDFVVETMTPLSIVESRSFEKLIEGASKLSKTSKIVGRRSLAHKIEEEYHQTMNKIKNSLQAVDFVCTTADVWSSSKRSYLGMTIHWIDNDTLKRRGTAIACRRFKGAHTYDKVAEIINEVHSEFNLKLYKITKTITDNASNMVKAFKMFGRSESVTLLDSTQSNKYNIVCSDKDDDDNDVDDENDLLPQAFPEPVKDVNDYELPSHERCATHTLHLIAAVDIKQTMTENSFYKKAHNSAFGKCQALWNLCAKSPKACETYLSATGKSSTSPCPTRWNSYYDSVNDLLAVKENLNEALKSLKLPLFKETDLQFLGEYVRCLKPIAEAIQSLEGEKDTYYGILLPELIRITKIFSSLKIENFKYCGNLIEVLERNLNLRFKRYLCFESIANDAILASVTHPFFKMKWVPKEKKEHVKTLFLMEIRKSKQNENDQKDSNTEKKKRDESYFMFHENESSDSSSTSETTGDLEALQYLQDKDTSLSMLNSYPTVKKVFLQYNTCLPSSAPVERLFSYGRLIMRPHRRKMGDRLFEQLVLLKSSRSSTSNTT